MKKLNAPRKFVTRKRKLFQFDKIKRQNVEVNWNCNVNYCRDKNKNATQRNDWKIVTEQDK